MHLQKRIHMQKYVYPCCLLFQKDICFKKEKAFLDKYLFPKFRSRVSACVEKIEMDSRSIQRVKPGLSQQPCCAFEAKSMKVAVEKWRTAISVSVNTALGVAPILLCPTVSLLYFIQWNLLLSPNLLYKVYFMLPLSFSYPSVKKDHSHSTLERHIYQKTLKKEIFKKR